MFFQSNSSSSLPPSSFSPPFPLPSTQTTNLFRARPFYPSHSPFSHPTAVYSTMLRRPPFSHSRFPFHYISLPFRRNCHFLKTSASCPNICMQNNCVKQKSKEKNKQEHGSRFIFVLFASLWRVSLDALRSSGNTSFPLLQIFVFPSPQLRRGASELARRIFLFPLHSLFRSSCLASQYRIFRQLTEYICMFSPRPGVRPVCGLVYTSGGGCEARLTHLPGQGSL